ncbi:MAG: 1-acyl-sn-glycerol-3-phosphate acyltransferase [Pelolinea sp.]|jgi:1-acyl-sn-glycerol-3-phosphate acyltransferase|nr:1-acyl-sn-glycerol-3-phosphate acyltransferase [Pelolinea sp.]
MNWKKRFLLNTGRTIMNIFARFFLEFNVHYEAPLAQGAKVFAPNHPTTTDPFLLSLVTEEPLIILVNKKIMQIPFIGKVIEQAGTIPVDKENGNGEEIIHRSIQILQQNFPIAIFPEGRLTPEVSHLSDLHTGVARIALSAEVPIVPVGIYVNPQFIRRYFFHRKYELDESRWLLHGKYYITIGQPLFFEGDVEDRELVREFIHRVSLEIERLMLASERRAVQKSIAWNPIIPFASQLPHD